MEIFNHETKKQLLDALEGIRRGIPLMDMDDRDFVASLLYRMAQIVREHGPNHGVSLNSPVIDEMAYHPGTIRIGDFVFKPSGSGVAFGKVPESKAKPKITEADIAKVIYNPPATVIYWKDGSKTVVKCSDHDLDEGRLSPETGVVYAIAKKVLGNKGNYNDVLRRLVKRAKKS